MRWDYYAPVKEKNNLFSDFIPTSATTGSLEQVGPGGLSNVYQPDYKNFSPRVAAAWDVLGNGKTVVRAGYGLFFDAFSQDMLLGHLPYPTFYAPGPAYNNIGPGSVQMANANPGRVYHQPGSDKRGETVYTPNTHIYGTPGCTVECDTFSFDQHIKTPYIENYNLNIQQQLARNVALQVGYVGSQGHRLFRFFDLNQPSQAAINAAIVRSGLATCATTGAIQDFGVPRPYAFPAGGFNTAAGSTYVFQENSTGISNYNSLQASLRVNNYHGFMSIVNYVWSNRWITPATVKTLWSTPHSRRTAIVRRRNMGLRTSTFRTASFGWLAMSFPRERRLVTAEERLGGRQHSDSAERPTLHPQL